MISFASNFGIIVFLIPMIRNASLELEIMDA
jgi:hypothetical protein